MSGDIELNFEGGTDRTISLSDRSQLVLRLLRLPSGQHSLVVCAPSYLLNCAYDMIIRHCGLNIALTIPAQDPTLAECEIPSLEHALDFSDFSGFFSDAHLDELQV